MENRKRLVFFLLLNIAVSAVTTWIVVGLMNKRYPQVAVSIPIATLESGADIEDQSPGTINEGAGNQTDNGIQTIIAKDQMMIDSIIGAGDIDNERVRIRYTGEVEIPLAGWQLQDEDGNSFTFPALTMFTGGAVK